MDIDKFKRRLQFSKQHRNKQDIRRYLNETFIDSNTYRSVDTYNNRLIQTNTDGVVRKVNLSRSIIRNLINSITRNDPRRYAEKARLKNKSNKEERRIANIILSTIWNEEDCNVKLKDLIRCSIIKSIGFRQIYHNPENDESMEISIENIDAFDIYVDPTAKMNGGWINARRIIKAIPVPLDEVKENNKYINTTELKADSKAAESDRKEQMIVQEKSGNMVDPELGTIMVYEIYRKKKVNGKKHVFFKTFTNEVAISDEIDLGIDKYPILGYQMERMGGRMYPTEWADPVVEMNKSINKLASSVENYVHTIVKGRYLKRRGENLSTINGKHGQIIEFDNVMPQVMPIAPINDVPFVLMGYFERRTGDTGGSHAMSSGRAQAVKTRSSKGLELMQNMDTESVSEPVDNLKTFLSNVAEVILMISAKKLNKLKKIYWNDEEIQVTGETKDTLKGPYRGAVPIRPFKGIYVDIMPGSIYNDLQKRQDLINLRQIGVNIPDKYIIEAFQIGNTDDVLSEMQAEEDKNRNPDIDLAEAENKKMIKGQPVHADIEEDHRIHKAIHAKLLQGIQGQDTNLEQLIITHIQEHEMVERGGENNPIQLENNQNRQPI